MVSESHYWKRELLKLSKKLTKRTLHNRFWTEAQFCTFEKEIMMGFYIIRKLIEAYKLSNQVVSTKVEGIKLANIGKIVHLMNNHKYYEYFDFDNPKQEKFDLLFLSNQIVHSYVFAPAFDESFCLSAIHFSSDKDRNKWLYEISITTIISIFDKVGSNYPASSSMYFDETKKDHKVHQKNTADDMPDIAEVNQLLAEFDKKKE